MIFRKRANVDRGRQPERERRRVGRWALRRGRLRRKENRRRRGSLSAREEGPSLSSRSYAPLADKASRAERLTRKLSKSRDLRTSRDREPELSSRLRACRSRHVHDRVAAVPVVATHKGFPAKNPVQSFVLLGPWCAPDILSHTARVAMSSEYSFSSAAIQASTLRITTSFLAAAALFARPWRPVPGPSLEPSGARPPTWPRRVDLRRRPTYPWPTAPRPARPALQRSFPATPRCFHLPRRPLSQWTPELDRRQSWRRSQTALPLESRSRLGGRRLGSLCFGNSSRQGLSRLAIAAHV